MDESAIHKMATFFESGITKQFDFRRQQLLLLGQALDKWQGELSRAIYRDMHRCQAEAFITETGCVQAEIRNTWASLPLWAKQGKFYESLIPFRSTIPREPRGVSLIIAPWTYPLQLLLGPLVAAIAAGNCAILKPSEFTQHTNAVLKQMLSHIFDDSYVQWVEGAGADVVPGIINRVDHIYFTGSASVGAAINEMATAANIPVALAAGTKNPCIVDKDADLVAAARRICRAKFTNAGQTCIAPDYLIVHESVRDELLRQLRMHIDSTYGTNPQSSAEYARIMAPATFDKLQAFLRQGTVIYGGATDRRDLFIAPTLIDVIDTNLPLMQEEIFGPLLPILTFKTHEDALRIIARQSSPLLLFLFTANKKNLQIYNETISYGSACINNTLIQLTNPAKLPGWVPGSGLTPYKGRSGYDVFSHPRQA